MATSIQSSRWLSTTDELFREWGKAISDGIRAVGLIQTEDTGQVDWATVSAPTAHNQAAGYEVWRFNDALQDTHPVFIKLEYGAGLAGSNAVHIPGMWVTIGRSTDGAGGVTGVLAGRRPASSGTAYVSAPAAGMGEVEPIYISSDGSSLSVVPRIRSSSSPYAGRSVEAFILDRSRDAAGNPTAVGGVILTEGHGSTTRIPNWSTNSSNGAAPAQMHAWTYAGDFTMGDAPAILPDYVNSTALSGPDVSLADGDRAPIFPYIVTVPGHEPWQVLAAVAVAAGDAANGPFTATTLGRLRNYRSIPVTDSHNRWATGRSGAYAGLCILWED